jgi:tyrosyl-tRNA synthetase
MMVFSLRRSFTLANVYDVLKERGFTAQVTHEEQVYDLLGKEPVTFYVGFDPTANSLHIGHFLTMMAMSHLQDYGHKPIALIGGGTAMVGDPTGKTEMRSMLSVEQIRHNAECIKKQLARFLRFDEGSAIIVNNADWLMELKYVELLRDIGVHFSVNRMLTAECFKSRLERGLSFIEFNYMLMQAYDFLQLNQRYNCRLQLGGDDQWSNIIAGIELIRRKEGTQAFGLTLSLLTTSTGKKMGKTEQGAVWLDPELFSPYDFYQYFRNVDDVDVERFLALLTKLPMEEVRRLGSLKDEQINQAKGVLAYEVTKIVHGQAEADKARQTAEAIFTQGSFDADIPTFYIPRPQAEIGINIVDLLIMSDMAATKSEGRRLISQGGVYLNEERVSDIEASVKADQFIDGSLIIRKGKKLYHRLCLK